jgi:hypothetical protein
MEDAWSPVIPEVDNSAEFLEILSDFEKPLEIVREAISNSIDWKANYIRISFDFKLIRGRDRLIICMTDDGTGMTEKRLEKNFLGIRNKRS